MPRLWTSIPASRHPLFNTLLFGVSAFLFLACAPAPNKSPSIPPNVNPTRKPDPVSISHASRQAMIELGHVERAIKPLFGGGSMAATLPADLQAIAASDACRSTQTTNRAMWETTWKCGLDSTERGRKEIEGVERINYDHETRLLTYDAKFEIRNFDDREPRANAHTLVTGRRFTIKFDAGSTATSARATIRMKSLAALKNEHADSNPRKGSNWTASLEGVLIRTKDDWSLDKKAKMLFDGALYGVDDERKTEWASGSFYFVSDSAIQLTGLGSTSCTKPFGTWTVTAAGDGQKIDTRVTSSEAGVAELSGRILSWPQDLCQRP